MTDCIRLDTGDTAPDFALSNDRGETVSLKAVSYTHLTLPTIYSV